MADGEKAPIGIAAENLTRTIAQTSGISNLAAASRAAGLTPGAIPTFLDRMSRDWKAGVPSANLWTVKIIPHNSGNMSNAASNISTLLASIKAVNASYQSRISTEWAVSNDPDIVGITSAHGGNSVDIGLFMADNISFSNNSVSINEAASSENIPFGGFIQFGKAATNRNQSLQARIRFMANNVDINEVFIDRWIAAIAQQGLIESSAMPNIKADIFLSCYAASFPMGKGQSNYVRWKRRKEYKLTKCFPISREQTNYGYSVDDAMMKYYTVNFSVQNYNVRYVPDGNYKDTNITVS